MSKHVAGFADPDKGESMFSGFDATICSVTFRRKETKGAIRRACELLIETDFSAEIAESIGKEAKRWREDLISIAAEQIKIPISALQVTAGFTAADGSQHRVPVARGMSAVGLACSCDEDDPRIKIRLLFSLRNEDAAWFPMRIGDVVHVTCKETQLSLIDDDRQTATG